MIVYDDEVCFKKANTGLDALGRIIWYCDLVLRTGLCSIGRNNAPTFSHTHPSSNFVQV